MAHAAGAIMEVDEILHTTDVQRFTASGSWPKPAGAQRVRVQLQQGGSAGGGAAATGATTMAAGGGGEGGHYAESWFDADDLTSSVTVTLGAAGVGVSGATGGNAGACSFGAYVTVAGAAAAGGEGAAASATAPSAARGGNSTPTITGDVQIGGDAGNFGLRLGAGLCVSGGGGASHMGGGAAGVAANTAGVAGKSYGGGGSGAANGFSQSARAGGAGGGPICIVTTYV